MVLRPLLRRASTIVVALCSPTCGLTPPATVGLRDA